MMSFRIRWSHRWAGPVVVMAIICMIVAVVFPAIQSARGSARRDASRNHLKYIGLALSNYHDSNSVLPPGGVFDTNGKAFHGWMSSIVPYFDQNSWFSRVNFNVPWDDPSNIALFQPGHPGIYCNPSISERCGRDGLVRTHYAGSDVVFYRNSSTRYPELASGLTQTLCMGDAHGNFEPFGYPFNWRSAALGLNSTPNSFGCSVRDDTQVLMVDGQVRSLSKEIDKDVFLKMRGTNSKWDTLPADTSKPDQPYELSPPNICLWADPISGSSLLGTQNESQEVIRAWFLNSESTWPEIMRPNCDSHAHLLKSHKSIRELNVWDALSDRGIQVLEELPNLEVVRITGRSVTDCGFESLSHIPNLKRLELESTALGRSGWKSLAKAPHLEAVSIEFNNGDVVHFTPKDVVEFLDQNSNHKVSISIGPNFKFSTLRELAKEGKPFPPYDRTGSK